MADLGYKPIMEEAGSITVNEMRWCWDSNPANAELLYVGEQSKNRVYKFAAYKPGSDKDLVELQEARHAISSGAALCPTTRNRMLLLISRAFRANYKNATATKPVTMDDYNIT